MKTRTAIAVIVMMIAVQYGTAGEPAKRFATAEKKIEFAKKNLMNGLKSGNTGVIESALRLTAQMKMQYPATDVSDLLRAIDQISVEHPSGTTRYKAYIVSSICLEPEWYSQAQDVITANEENFFRTASAQLNKKLFSNNSL
ncbi:MAG: hypothetical protein HYV29_03315 [Ignavibacteriales bacterium]|nr:hypothetical protein [Ignavibacteriales bacterium]